MGMTCLFQSREYPTAQPFEPPAWAHRYDSCDELPYGAGGHRWWQMGYWWVELGGEAHSIHDTESLRDELLKITFGVWDHVKNRCPHKAEAANWALEWVQFLPAKRESRRYLGAHVLTQNDIEAGGISPTWWPTADGPWTITTLAGSTPCRLAPRPPTSTRRPPLTGLPTAACIRGTLTT